MKTKEELNMKPRELTDAELGPVSGGSKEDLPKMPDHEKYIMKVTWLRDAKNPPYAVIFRDPAMSEY